MDSSLVLLTLILSLVFIFFKVLKKPNDGISFSNGKLSEMFAVRDDPPDNGFDAGNQAIRCNDFLKWCETSGRLDKEAEPGRVSEGVSNSSRPDLLGKVMMQVSAPLGVLLIAALIFFGLKKCFAKLMAKHSDVGNEGEEGTKQPAKGTEGKEDGSPEEVAFDNEDKGDEDGAEDDGKDAEDDGKDGKRKKPQKKGKKIQVPKHPKKKDHEQTQV